MNFCGIDAVEFERQWKMGKWNSVLGACVFTSSYEDFQARYKKAIKEQFKRMGFDVKRTVHSSHSINSVLQNSPQGYNFFEFMLSECLDCIDKINLVFSYYPKMDEIYMFSDKRPSSLPPSDFIKRHLLNSYPHVCAWHALKSNSCTIMMDSFNGYLTHAWEEIESYDKINIYFNGDECNPLISMADITLRIANERLLRENMFLGKQQVLSVFEDLGSKISVDFLGRSQLPLITPRNNISIPIFRKIKHPVFFILRPKTDYLDNKIFLNSPRGHDILELAHIKQGCAKIYNKDEDINIMQDGDFLVFTDKNGDIAAQTIIDLGYNVEKYHIKQIDALLQKAATAY